MQNAANSDAARYAGRGVSASKGEVHAAVDKLDRGLFPGAFCKITEDFLTGDAALCNLIHGDGAGTKSLLAYLWWREHEAADPRSIRVFRGIAQDSIVMNVDDLLCAGVTGGVLLSSTINRNARRIPGAVLAELIEGTEEFLETLRTHGFGIRSGGGETADVGDLTATLTVDSTATAVLRRDAVVDAARIRPGLAIVGLASGGAPCIYEKNEKNTAGGAVENSGIGSNGLTSARHELLSKHYAEFFPETFDHTTDPALVYCGPHRLDDALDGSALSVGAALLSPTRTYAPFVIALLKELGVAPNAGATGGVFGLVHCSGGAQTKCLRFGGGDGAGVHFVKDNLFPVPPVFRAIQKASGTGAWEMHKVYNMGHRLEVFVEERDADRVIAIAGDLGIEARVVGRTEPTRLPDGKNHATVTPAAGGAALEYRL
ncbi:MAG: phosphoribosylformylglycinamidine cyclo-ligase [Puniceicoccales bacterium]|jgi:phosphoribosylformylglycinamidine cyclo-ligase|nr:phosphoribosylformylglycinamidine cyclo-ligase [Puniceicoccales bacterium]